MINLVVFFALKTKIFSLYFAYLAFNTKFINIITKIDSNRIEKFKSFKDY